MAGGRPTKCTPEVITQFADYMGAGLYFEDACDLCHITRSTGYHWLDEGEAALEEAGGDIDAIDDDNRRMWATFSDTVRARSAQAIARNLAIIQQAAGAKVEGDWRAAEAFLKMRRPDTWGMRRSKTEVSGSVTIVPVFGAEDPLGGGEHHGPDADGLDS